MASVRFVCSDNPLLIVNGRINLIEAPQVRRGRPRVTQEAAHIVQTQTALQAVAH